MTENTEYLSVNEMASIEEKKMELTNDFTVSGLKKMCVKYNLSEIGTKDELAGRIAVHEAERENVVAEHINNDDGAGVNREVMQEMVDALQSTNIEPTRRRAFREVIGSFRKFRGDGTQDITEWLREFDEIANSSGWDATEKLQNLLKSLEDDVFECVSRAGKDYEAIKTELRRRFSNSTEPEKMIRNIMQRKKQRSETARQYVADMERWGRMAKLNDRMIIQLSVDGLYYEAAIKYNLARSRDSRTG